MFRFDLRWIAFPVACLTAIERGNISWWVILPIIIGCFPIILTFKKKRK